MPLTKWFNYLFLILLGGSLPFIAYKINAAYEADAYSQQHSPLINMPVVGRQKGWGTVRFPNKIYVQLHGKHYVLPCSNQYFQKTATQDSLFVYYDGHRDRAVLAEGTVTAPSGLLALLGSCGLIMISATVIHLRRQLRKRNQLL
ncbi:hypothetical protein [Spirosoma koreense]